MSKNKKYKPRTEAQKIARRERDRKRRELLRRNSQKPIKNANKAKVAKIADNAKRVNASPLEMIAAGLSVIAVAVSIAARRS